ncbi:GGDEF domain-containing protein [Shewanella sp.]|uniref:GGDEF domain-containing protein n=1 Tax=Shewanella sp. TaxID=50422 RepID=UPI003568C933
MDKTRNKFLDLSASILRQAVPQMSALGIPVTPENYAVWYQYFLGQDLALVSAIEALLSNKVEFNTDVCLGLYNNFVLNKAPEVLENVQLETIMLINSLLSRIGQLSQGSESFQTSIESFGKQLQQDNDPEALHGLVKQVLADVDKVLSDHDLIRDSLRSMREELDHLQNEINELSVISVTDKLTGLHNRRAYEDEVARQLAQDEHKCCLLVIDIDWFKHFNDTWGHNAGDKVLVYVAHNLKMGVKGDDFVARYGGEEFVILLKDTSAANACLVAESLRERIAHKTLKLGKDQVDLGKITVSIGVAELRRHEEPEALFERADKALFQAKKSGRNLIKLARD